MRFLACFIVVLLIAPLAHAAPGHLKLLAVTEDESGIHGASADLYVEVRAGQGRVYMDTFPLSRIDTQISTRFAKEIACQFSQKDCDEYDFFYTIRSTSAIIAGPSAGAALTALTLAQLEGYAIDDTATVTGTINSGGLIGPVSGIKEKLDAAKAIGLREVFIPAGEGIEVGENGTTNYTEYGASIGLTVTEALQLSQVVERLSGVRLPEQPTNFTVDPTYAATMASLSQDLCARARQLRDEAGQADEPLLTAAQNLTDRGLLAKDQGQNYAAASYCFGANVRFSQLALQREQPTAQALFLIAERIRANIHGELDKIPAYKTTTDVEAFALVLERLTEAQESVEDALTDIDQGDLNASIRGLAFADERLLSARSWARFFGTGGTNLTVDAAGLQTSCITKLAEAEERFQYVRLFFPEALHDTRDLLDSAYRESRNQKYDVCFFKASRAKAEADAILSVLGVKPARVQDVLDQKEKAVRIAIAQQAAHGSFPIAGYSYLEYARSLRTADPASAVLFYEYALELSDLDAYFARQAHELSQASLRIEYSGAELLSRAFLILLGMLIGLLMGIMIFGRKDIKKAKGRVSPSMGAPRGAHMRGKKR